MHKQILLFLTLLLLSRAAVAAEPCAFRTGNNAVYILPDSAAAAFNGVPLSDGARVTAHRPSGRCVGELSWKSGPQYITVWGDNEMTEAVDGLLPGEEIQFRLHDADETAYARADVVLSEGSMAYRPDGIGIIQALVAAPVEGIGEVGRLAASQKRRSDRHAASLARAYAAPVVIMQPLSYNGGHPAHARLTKVTASGFEFRIEEWGYLDGGHTTETLPYLVMESGPLQLADGTPAEAGRLKTDHTWRRVSFRQSFAAPPVVLAQAQTANEPQPVVVRLRNVTKSGFEVRLQEEEASDGRHAVETVGFVALAPGRGDGGRRFEAGRTKRQVTHTWKRIAFSESVADPVLLAGLQTYHGSDPAGLRYRRLGAGSVEVFVEEEQSRDEEQRHVAEQVGFFVFAGSGPIEGRTSAALPAAAVADRAVAAKAALPAALELEASYPNPFKTNTTIRYALPEAARVRLEVFNVRGRRVAVLVDAVQAAGYRTVSFRAQELPSGLYFYRLRAGSRVLTRKMLLVR